MSATIISRCLVALIVLPLISTQLFAKGGNPRNEDYYDPAHLNRLPPEVRATVFHQCSTARAMHPFAEYKGNLRTLILHYSISTALRAERIAAVPGACMRFTALRTVATGL
jgi:hypothetical protein